MISSVGRPNRPVSSDQIVDRPGRTTFSHVAGAFFRKALAVLLSILVWIALLIFALISGLFIAISFIGGPIHWAICVVLAALWFALIGFLIFRPRSYDWRRAEFSVISGFIVLGLLTVTLSQLSAYTPPIVDAQGNPVPGSIATLERINIGGSDQWISIRGKSTTNPVLLFLAGGPGGTQLGALRNTLGKAGLEDHFVVVDWEQPGSGKSFDSVERSQLTPERYISDGHELITYLLQRFQQQKLYIVGESWGSALGIMLAQRYPDLLYAFVGTGQMVDFTECDLLCYQFALTWAQEQGNTGKVTALQNQGPPPYYGNDVAWKEATYLLDTYAYMNQNPAIYHEGNTFADLLSPEYGLYDKISWLRGPLDTLNHVYPQLWGVDFRKQAARLDIPIYFFIGRHDINAPVSLTEEYYNLLQAPHKELVWFEHSGHTPWVSEANLFVDMLVNKVLDKTGPQDPNASNR